MPTEASGSASSRGPLEVHTGMVRCEVHAQREPDGRWAARVPHLTTRCEMAETREEAIRLACEAVSIPKKYGRGQS